MPRIVIQRVAATAMQPTGSPGIRPTFLIFDRASVLRTEGYVALDLDREQRSLRADKLFDAGNVAAGAVVFGQFVAGRPFSILLAGMGLGIWLTALTVSVALKRVES